MNRHPSILAAVLLPMLAWAQGSRFIGIPLVNQQINTNAAITSVSEVAYSGRIIGFAVSDSSTGILASVKTVATNGMYNSRTLLSVTCTADSVYYPRVYGQSNGGVTINTNELIAPIISEEFVTVVVTNLHTNLNTARIYMLLE